MKNILSAILLMISLSTLAAQELSSISEKGSKRQIIIEQHINNKKEQDLVFILKDGAFSEELNRLSYSSGINDALLKGKYQSYNFNLLSKGVDVSGGIYAVCWEETYGENGVPFNLAGGALALGAVVAGASGGTLLVAGAAIAGIGIGACTILPAAPAVIGIGLLPLDALITGFSYLTSPKAIANRKLEKAMSGKDKKVARKAFNLIIKRVKKL
jgi:hypothetical protein